MIKSRFLALAATLLLCTVAGGAPATADSTKPLTSVTTNTNAGATSCGVAIEAAPTRARQVNLVLDDSGSMFTDGAKALDRWSNAKYSLEVFAAMLDEKDTLNVYRMSDFAEGAKSGPVVVIAGTDPTSQRIAKIHTMSMHGGGTPYAPVQAAVDDLAKSAAPDKWLVVLSDGEFGDRSAADVQGDFARFVAENSGDGTRMQVAFLAIGAAAPELQSDPIGGVFFERATETSELLHTMTGFSNRIFARSLLPQSSPGKISTDIEMDELLVFAQGPTITMGSLNAAGVSVTPQSDVDVSWANNPDIDYPGIGKVVAVPNQALSGKLASYENVPAGTGAVDVSGATTIDIFYKPRVAFGIELYDPAGNKVEADKIVGGEVTVQYGFMDSNCEFIESSLLGDVAYTAEVTQNGEIVADSFAPGDALNLTRGDAQFTVSASYLNGNPTEAVIDLKVLRPAKPTEFAVSDTTFSASKLGKYSAPKEALKLHYGISEGGVATEFSAEEWASFTPESFTVTTEKDLEFDISLGANPGELYVVPRAPGGDIYAASTGEIPIVVTASHVFDEQLNEARFDTSVAIADDISFLDRLTNWFVTVGWIWLLIAIILLLFAGYVFQKRFPKKLKARPVISFRPKQLGAKPGQFSGKFVRNRASTLVPFGAHTGTISYVPSGTSGFMPLKVKAAGRGRFQIVNWKKIAEKENVAFNGEPLTKQSTRAQALRATSMITATSPQGTYDMKLDSARVGKSKGRKR